MVDGRIEKARSCAILIKRLACRTASLLLAFGEAQGNLRGGLYGVTIPITAYHNARIFKQLRRSHLAFTSERDFNEVDTTVMIQFFTQR